MTHQCLVSYCAAFSETKHAALSRWRDDSVKDVLQSIRHMREYCLIQDHKKCACGIERSGWLADTELAIAASAD